MTWLLSNALELPFKNEFDVLFVSGFSPYNSVQNHHEAKAITEKLSKYLVNGGLMFFLWVSNLSNQRAESGRMNYSVDSLKKLFANVDEMQIVDIFLTRKLLFPLLGRYALSQPITKLLSFAGLKNIKPLILVCVLEGV